MILARAMPAVMVVVVVFAAAAAGRRAVAGAGTLPVLLFLLAAGVVFRCEEWQRPAWR